jgi:hypothetical protein
MSDQRKRTVCYLDKIRNERNKLREESQEKYKRQEGKI